MVARAARGLVQGAVPRKGTAQVGAQAPAERNPTELVPPDVLTGWQQYLAGLERGIEEDEAVLAEMKSTRHRLTSLIQLAEHPVLLNEQSKPPA